jgi:N-dimethylarginine dimethylaminohydrolase
MCAPAHFGSAPANAQRQWERLVALLLDVAHASVELVPAHPGLPEIVFTANAALICDRLAIVSTFRNAGRRGEERVYRERLAELGYATTQLDGVFFEGAGDALFDRRLCLLYAGYGWRSDRASAMQLHRLCDVRVLPLHLVDPRFSHLDTCLCPLSHGHVLAYMPAFSSKSQARLRMTLGEYLIEVDESDALTFACNAVEVDRTVVFHRASGALRGRLYASGYRVLETDLSDFHASGGSAKCLTLKLDDGPVRRPTQRAAI